MSGTVHDLLEDVFNGLDLGVVVIDREYRILSINPWLARMNGLSVEALIGKTVRAVVPHIAPEFEALIARVFDSGETRSADIVEEAPRAHVDRTVWSVTCTPVRRDGEIVATTATVTDATARRTAEDALRMSELQFRAICEASPVGIFLTDAAGSSLYSNPENLKQMGLTFEESLGYGWERALHPEDVSCLEDYAAAMAQRRPYEIVARYVHKNGRTVFANVKTRAIYDGNTFLGYLGIVEDITERRAAESALRESELRFRQLAEHIDSIFWLWEPGKVAYVSPAYAEVWGRPVEELLANESVFLESVHPEDRARVAQAVTAHERNEIEYRIIRPDGEIRWISDRRFPIRHLGSEVIRKAGIATDITRQKALETQLLQTQKLDSIGRLAGGIAHDFNNLLTVILSQTKMASRAFAAGRNGIEELTQIEEAATRAAELTAHLLTFARRQVTHPTPLDPREVAADIEKLLRRVIGDDIKLVSQLDADVGVVRADRSQLEQVLVNLAVNARDAMPNGGTLTIEMRNITLDRTDAPAGPYVMLSMTDTGHGISVEDRERIFDPFYTTKPPGEGTGLGLATCYGIVKQHGGIIEVESEIGKGTSFHVYLPRIDARAEQLPQHAAREAPTPIFGTENVLVVEDDAAVRAVAIRALREHGFRAVEATNGEEALALLAQAKGEIDIMVTDVVMRGMDGRELAKRAHQDFPTLPMLLTSGYAEDLGGMPFLQKPYVPALLVKRVRELLDRGRS